MKRWLVIVVLIAAAWCLYTLIRAPYLKTECDIREALYRHLFTHNYSGLQRSAKGYYLSVRVGLSNPNPEIEAIESDPPSQLLDRFRGHVPPVKRGSDCIAEADRGVHDKKTYDKGLIITTGGIVWLSDTAVEVEGGYYEGGLSASGSIYRLIKRKGKWVVVRERMIWIS